MMMDTVIPRYNAPRYNADLAITRFFAPKVFLPNLLRKVKSFNQSQIFSKISQYTAIILVEMLKFAMNQDHNKKFLQ